MGDWSRAAQVALQRGHGEVTLLRAGDAQVTNLVEDLCRSWQSAALGWEGVCRSSGPGMRGCTRRHDQHGSLGQTASQRAEHFLAGQAPVTTCRGGNGGAPHIVCAAPVVFPEQLGAQLTSLVQPGLAEDEEYRNENCYDHKRQDDRNPAAESLAGGCRERVYPVEKGFG